MALRTFRSNPSLGGFGGETSGSLSVYGGHNGDDDDDDDNGGGIGGRQLGAVHRRKGSKRSNARDNATATRQDQSFNSTADDGFAQIVKELVDNAVDACYTAYEEEMKQQTMTTISRKRNFGARSSTRKNNAQCQDDPPPQANTNLPKLRRVRIVMEAIPAAASTGPSTQNSEVLRLTVTDNGLGMKDIEACVSAFHTSKVGGSGESDSNKRKAPSSAANSNVTSTTKEQQSYTAGRYGIGLTLCLLHAQRLVPHSCASITSSTSSHAQWTRAKYVVDTDQDCVTCISKQQLPKRSTANGNEEDESGTSVSLLLPVSFSAWASLLVAVFA
jgi:hypothetical protein